MKIKNLFQSLTLVIICVSLFVTSCQKDQYELPDTTEAATVGKTGTTGGGAGCPEGNIIILRSQSDIDAFAQAYSNCTTIEGDLTIFSEANDPDPVVSLEPLSFLLEITGDLSIRSTSFEDLNILYKIGGSLEIKENPLLSSLSFDEDIFMGNGPYRVEITNNPLLSTCELEALCTYAENGGIVTIQQNGQGCSSVGEVCVTVGTCAMEINAWTSNIRKISAKINVDEILDAVGYTVRVRRLGRSRWSIVQSTNRQCCLGLPVIFPIQGLKAGTDYEFQVRYECASGNSNWNQAQTFTTRL